MPNVTPKEYEAMLEGMVDEYHCVPLLHEYRVGVDDPMSEPDTPTMYTVVSEKLEETALKNDTDFIRLMRDETSPLNDQHTDEQIRSAVKLIDIEFPGAFFTVDKAENLVRVHIAYLHMLAMDTRIYQMFLKCLWSIHENYHMEFVIGGGAYGSAMLFGMYVPIINFVSQRQNVDVSFDGQVDLAGLLCAVACTGKFKCDEFAYVECRIPKPWLNYKGMNALIDGAFEILEEHNFDKELINRLREGKNISLIGSEIPL